jgi:hypothetical protein
MDEPEDRLAQMAEDVEEFGYSFDAVFAIMTAAALDGRLERLLIREMTPINRDLKDRLFTGYGALSEFAAKIDLAYALHTISKSVYRELRIVKKVRDIFAHSRDMLEHREFTNFKTPKVAALLSKLDLDMGVSSMRLRYMMKIADLTGELVHGYRPTKNPDKPQIARVENSGPGGTSRRDGDNTADADNEKPRPWLAGVSSDDQQGDDGTSSYPRGTAGLGCGSGYRSIR